MTEKDFDIGDEVSAVILISARITGFNNSGTLVNIDLTDWILGAVGTSRIEGIPISQIQKVEK